MVNHFRSTNDQRTLLPVAPQLLSSGMEWFAGQIQDGLWRWWWSCAPRLVVVVRWSRLPLNRLVVWGLAMGAEAQWGWYLTICCTGSQGKKECSTFPNAYACSASNRNSIVPCSSCQFQNVLRHHVLCEKGLLTTEVCLEWLVICQWTKTHSWFSLLASQVLLGWGTLRMDQFCRLP